MYCNKYLKYKNKYLVLKGGSNNIKLHIDKTIINSYNIYTKEEFDGEAFIDFDYDHSKLYTTLMVDENAINTEKGKYYLHLLKINNDKNILEYMPPQPPEKSGIHTYHIYVYEQPSSLSIMSYMRNNFDLTNFITINNLKEVGHFKYKVSN